MTERDAIVMSLAGAELLRFIALGGKTPPLKCHRVLHLLDQADRERPNMAGRQWRWRARERAA